MKKFILYIIVIFTTLTFNSLNAEILMKPYLQALTTNSVVIMVECDSKTPPKVKFGDKDNLKSEVTSQNFLHTENNPLSYVHRIKLNNLTPGKKYFYQVSQDKSKSEIYSFKVLETNPKVFKAAIYGDNRSNPKIFNKVIEKVIPHNPDLLFITGDIAYNNKYQFFKDEFFTPTNQNLISNYCFFNSPGNHEGWSNNTKAFLESPESNSGTKDYYSLEFDDYYFLILNQEVSYKKGSAQWKFAEEDLKRTKAKYKFVCVHKPAYGAGAHGEDKHTVAMTKEIFEPNGVKFVFAGHSHFYQRNFVNNIYHLVLGGAGAPLYNPDKASYTQVSAKKHHYSIMTIEDGKIKIVVYDLDNNIIDSLETK